ncbi:MAG TPA: ABC transporter permease [Candidatus Competibacteraceae bacterium]|nr:ABC transporter permease [Candidatus Competibacteraceae bacterium]
MLTQHHLELIVYKTYADLKAETAKTYIGFIWWLLDPLLFMLTFYVVFELLLRQGTPDFIPFLLVGLITWRWFQNTVAHGAGAILQNRELMRQIYLPKIVFPLVTVLTDLVKFSLVFLILLLFLSVTGHPPGASYLALPLVLATEFLLIVALTCLTSAVVPFLPDLRILIEHGLHMLFFVSGIFFSSSQVPQPLHWLLYLNPMAGLIEAYRDILIRDQWPQLGLLSGIAGAAALACWGAYRLLTRYDHVYAKVVR